MENVYVQIEEIKGDARERKHIDWIPCKSISWNLERTVDMSDLGTTQRGFANAQFGKISLTTEMSKHSAKLCLRCASGVSHKKILIDLTKSGDDPSKGMETYLQFTLYDSQIDSYEVSGGEEQIPEETFTLAYRRIEYYFTPTDFKTNKLLSDKQEHFLWDLETNQSV